MFKKVFSRTDPSDVCIYVTKEIQYLSESSLVDQFPDRLQVGCPPCNIGFLTYYTINFCKFQYVYFLQELKFVSSEVYLEGMESR